MAVKKKNGLKRFNSLTKVGIIRALNFRGAFFIGLGGQIVFIIVIYFLWRAIYSASPTQVVNGMAFKDTLIYLVLANAIFNTTNVYIVYNICDDIQTGKIILDLLKPVSYSLLKFGESCGIMIVQFLTTFIPTFIIIYFLSGRAINIGINLIFFLVGLVLAAVINYCFNLCFACFCFYTESCWGIDVLKNCIVTLLSGAVIPIAFFPDWLKTAVSFMPFPAIYNAPLQMLLGDNTSFSTYGHYLLLQVFWVIVMLAVSLLLWNKSVKALTINGG